MEGHRVASKKGIQIVDSCKLKGRWWIEVLLHVMHAFIKWWYYRSWTFLSVAMKAEKKSAPFCNIFHPNTTVPLLEFSRIVNWKVNDEWKCYFMSCMLSLNDNLMVHTTEHGNICMVLKALYCTTRGLPTYVVFTTQIPLLWCLAYISASGEIFASIGDLLQSHQR